MGGSALNWPEEFYSELITQLVTQGKTVLLTAGPLESGILERVKRNVLNDLKETGSVAASSLVLDYGGSEARSIDFLAGLFSLASVVVAPSTGPLHVAVALKRRVVTYYPPIRVQSAVRWGPYLKDEDRAAVLVPDVYCGQDFKCRGPLCNYYPCMRSLTVEMAFEQVMTHLNEIEKESREQNA
jgi:ADP-heptose:LPS heptosyltransferase